MSIIRAALPLVAGFILASCGPKSPSTAQGPTSQDLTDQAQLPQSNSENRDSDLLAEPLASDPMGVTIHELSNGLKVYISTDRSTPSISSWVAVRAGSRHDPADSTGLAHYLEHMLFKGTSKLGSLDFAKEKPHLDKIAGLYDKLRAAEDADRPALLAEIDLETVASSQYAVPNEFDNLYAALGIDGVNAFTSNEQTVYISNVPSNRFNAWAKVEGERFQDPQFRLFYPELESVYEELNRSLDNPQSRMFHALFKGLFPKHPYGTQPTIGHPEHLKLPAYADMVDYYEKWYRPNNMAIALAGDIDAETALPVLEAHFGQMAAKELPALPAADLNAPDKRTEVEIVAPGEQSLMISWPTVPVRHPDEAALQVMDMLMDNSASGLLNIELVLSQKLPRAGTFPEHLREAGAWTMTGTAREGQSLEEVEALLMGVVGKLKAGDFTQADLDAIVINTEIQKKRSLEDNGGRVSAMTSAFIEGRPWSEVVSWQDKLRAVSKDDVVRVAKTYLTDTPVVVKRKRGEFAGPKVEKPTVTAIPIDSSKSSAYAAAIKADSVPPLKPQWLEESKHFQRAALPAGPFVSVTNDRNDLFAISYEFKFGEGQLPLMCLSLELLQASGAGENSPAQLQKTLYALGTSVYFQCDSRSALIHVTGVDRKMEDSLALVGQWLTAPKVQPGSLTKLKANLVSQRKDEMREPSVIARALAEYAFYGKASSFLNVPSNRDLLRASEEELVKVAQSLPNYKHRTSYFGPRNADQAKSLLAMGKDHQDAPKVAALTYVTKKKPTLYFVDQPVAQAQIRIGFGSPPLPLAERAKATLFNQYVGGGMGGLIFQEIREARGLAYSAWARYSSNSRAIDDSAVVAGLGTQADKTIEAVKTLLELIRPLEVEPTRFGVARTSVEADMRKTRVDPRSRSFVVSQWADWGITSDPRPKEFSLLAELTPEQLASFANKRTQNAPIIAISGDSKKIDLRALSKVLGLKRTQTMQVKTLFGY